MLLTTLRKLLMNRTITWVERDGEFFVIVLNDGTRYAISRDEEMNGPGELIKLR